MHALVLLLLHWSYIYGPTAAIRILSVRAQGLLRKVGRVRGHRQNAERVRVAKTALPALYSDDGAPRLDDVELEGIRETEADTVVHVGLPLVSLNTAGFGVPERIATSVEVNLPSGLLVASDWRQV